MASMWAKLRNGPEETIPRTIEQIPEASLWYFVAKDPNGNILSEGELPRFKLKLPDEYFNKPFRFMTTDKNTLIATIQF